jgi:cold shock CspA family protein
MEQQGRLTQWNDARGFGFISPQSKGPRIFVHISQFQERNRRPCLNELLTYTIDHDEQGRLRAKEVRYQQHSQPETVSKDSFWAAFPIKAALFILLGLVAIYFRLDGVSISKLFDRSFDKLFDQSFESPTTRVDKAGLNTYQALQSGAQMGGEGLVERVLADDNDGSRHQRFILRLASGQTLLIAHNIDIANRIEALRIGDRVQFYGQYESNPQGGVIHWTHHDPDGNHVAGWLKYNGMVYQ